MGFFDSGTRQRRWQEAEQVATAHVGKSLRSVAPDMRVPLEEFVVAHTPLVKQLFLDEGLLAPRAERITAYAVRFVHLTLVLASMDRSLAKTPNLRSQLAALFAPLYDEPVDAVQSRLQELGQPAQGASNLELWEVAGRAYTIIKRGVVGGTPRIEPEELRVMEQRFQQSHEHAVRSIARRLGRETPSPQP